VPVGQPRRSPSGVREFDPASGGGWRCLLRDGTARSRTSILWSRDAVGPDRAGTPEKAPCGAGAQGDALLPQGRLEPTSYSSVLEGWWKAAEFGCQILNNSWFDWTFRSCVSETSVVKLPISSAKAATELHRGDPDRCPGHERCIDPKKDVPLLPVGGFGLFHGLSGVVLIPQDMPNVMSPAVTGPATTTRPRRSSPLQTRAGKAEWGSERQEFPPGPRLKRRVGPPWVWAAPRAVPA